LDSRLFHVRPNLSVLVDNEVILFLRQEGRASGVEESLLRYETRKIAPPAFWESNPKLKRAMRRALQRRLASAAA